MNTICCKYCGSRHSDPSRLCLEQIIALGSNPQFAPNTELGEFFGRHLRMATSSRPYGAEPEGE